MKLGMTGKEIIKNNKGEWWYYFDPVRGWVQAIDEESQDLVRSIYRAFRDKSFTEEDAMSILKFNESVLKSMDAYNNSKSANGNQVDSHTIALHVAKDLINFFSEFHFEPNFRFVNTFCLMTKQSVSEAKDYVSSYFELSDSPFVSSLKEKMKSPEFDKIVQNISMIPEIKSKINTRFKLYYGSQGTGKTTKAVEESEGLCMVCHSAMLPSDLMEDFKFVDGKAEFQSSALQDAMVTGKVIVLDEINLLPFESLRFLQSILDGKKEFSYKGKTVKIADGFKIIGTMNLVVNGCVYSLPEPLIDRAEDLKKFSLTAENLAEALL